MKTWKWMELLKLPYVTLKLAECFRLTHTTSTSVISHRKAGEVIKLFQGFILLLVFRLDQYFPYISSEILHATDSLYFKIQFHACTHKPKKKTGITY